MRTITILPLIFLSLLSSPALSATSLSPGSTTGKSQSHSHNGRVHTHIIPASGIKHFHKHTHNGRSHIHPYSAEIGFKHTHNKFQEKVSDNSVNHEHGGRTHSHPLPGSGVNHQHRHKHGGRTHIHPLPVNGVNHVHQIYPLSKAVQNKSAVHQSNDLNSQISRLMKSPAGNSTPPKTNKRPSSKQRKTDSDKGKYAYLLKIPQKNTVKQHAVKSKSTTKIEKGYHQHDGRSHKHAMPKSGSKHYHNHAHQGRIHFHPTPISDQQHTHKSIKNSPMIATKPKAIPAIAKVKKSSKNARAMIKNKIKRATKRTVVKSKTNTKNNYRYKHKKKSVNTPSKKQDTSSNRQFEIGLRYEKGTGVEKNLKQAANWYRRSAEQGNTKAQFNLASLYEYGEGVEKNPLQALRWYTEAAMKGEVNAQVTLGNQYERGIGVARNIPEAIKWYQKAADQGDMRGRANLNYLMSR